jgi:hypothetical protein
VSKAALVGCESNPNTGTSAWAGFVGRFFNYSFYQNGEQDVEARVSVTADSTDPTAPLRVDGSYESGDGLFYNSQTLGYVGIGQTAKLRLKWDRANHQFIYQLNNNQPVDLLYGLADYWNPAVQVKALWVARGVPHCSSSPIPSAMMDAYFDNVYVNAL